MAVSDILKDIGEGVKTGAKAVGAVAQPIAERTAQVVSGEAPKIDEEQRQKQTDLEDAQINAKAQALESQLSMGQKYGTLTPAQQQQYVDQITGLYSHPRHAGVLMEKLRKAIHPNGAFAPGPSAPLANATPEGGTAAADTRNANAKKPAKPLTGVKPFKGSDGKYYQPVETADGKIENVEVPDYTPPPVKPAGGKTPPVAGNQLPSDAVGPDGNPIPEAERNAGKSYVEFHGVFYPVAPPKPVMRPVGGHLLLIDPQTGAKLRDIGPISGAKVTTHQTLQPGDDGQMHMVTLTSVTTPEGATIDVEPDQGQASPNSSAPGASKPKTPAKKVTPGSLLPKTGAKPAAPTDKSIVPGLSTLAHHKVQSNQDKQVLESSKQIISSIDDLLPILEKRKNEGGLFDAGKQQIDFLKYKHGIPPSDPEQTKIFENSALLGVVGASIWTRIGRSRYTFEIIQQHLPKPTDTPELMYDKVKWLKDNVVPAAQDAITNPQPDNSGAPPAGGGKTIVVTAKDME